MLLVDLCNFYMENLYAGASFLAIAFPGMNPVDIPAVLTSFKEFKNGNQSERYSDHAYIETRIKS